MNDITLNELIDYLESRLRFIYEESLTRDYISIHKLYEEIYHIKEVLRDIIKEQDNASSDTKSV